MPLSISEFFFFILVRELKSQRITNNRKTEQMQMISNMSFMLDAEELLRMEKGTFIHGQKEEPNGDET